MSETADVTLPLVINLLRKDGTLRVTDVELVTSRYVTNGNLALTAFCTATSRLVSTDGLKPGELCCAGETWGTLTTNVDQSFGDDRVLVKDYAEGEGYLTSLLAAGLVEAPTATVASGFVKDIPVCKLTPKGKAFVAASLKARKPEDGEGLA